MTRVYRLLGKVIKTPGRTKVYTGARAFGGQ